ncbi:MAG TPA: tetratricopeptide repeat protein [Bacteroidales bacterium]
MKTLAGIILATIFSLQALGQNAKKFYKTGEEFFKASNFQDAITQFTSAVALNPEYKDAYFMRGCSYEMIKDFAKAADDFNRAPIFEPKNEEFCYHIGKAYFELKKYPEALDILNKATLLNRKYLPAYQQKILVLIALDQSFNALKVSDTTLALDGNAYNYYLQGLVTEKLNSTQKAEWAYTKAIKEDKKYIDAYVALANLELTINKPEEAMARCNEALKIDPNSRQALLVRSKVFLKKLDYRNGIDDVSRAIVLNPDDENMFFVRGTYYQQFSQHQNAINDFNKVISLNPKNAEAYYRRANSYEEISNFPAAIKDYESLVAISEYDAKAKQLLKQAQDRLFELNRENDPPKLVLIDPSPKDKFTMEIPNNKKEIRVKGYATDKSALSYIKVNNKDMTYEKINGQYEFSAVVPVDSIDVITISTADVYNNLEKVNFNLKRTETDPPKVSIMAPMASDNGEIYLDSNDPSLYIEGKIADESPIKSILIEGVTASFKVDELNPTFAATIDINNKSKFTVTATDIYGNEKSYTFTLNRESASLLGQNPMGKTWVVFVENSNYHSFASLEGPTKDVSLMKAALVKYQVNNIIHRKDLTKEQMEKFFSIELRDLIRSNRVNTLLIWYAGHGKLINETGYWIPVDANRDEEFTYFNINSLKAWLQTYSSLTHTLLVTDACESGPTFFQAMRAALRERSCDDWQATRLKSSQVFSSAGYELAQDNSQFTKTFANLLASNPNACIPIESIVMKISSTAGAQQKPKFGKIAGLTDEDGTFFFIAKDK